MAKTELDRTKRLSDLVSPLRNGALGPVFDFHLLVETMRFLLLDKRNRPFLILKESEFGGPVTAPTGLIWPHSIEVLIENIANERATCTSGHATLLLDKEVVRPSFFLNQFTLEARVASRCTIFMSEETYIYGTSPSHKFVLYINLEYHGNLSDRKYRACLWSTYDPIAGSFKESFTDLQVSVSGESFSSGETETKWRRSLPR